MKKFLVVGIIILFIGMTVSSSTGFNSVEQSNIPITNGKILYVGGNGTGNYTKIQDAIHDAEEGDTVYVFDDSSPYYERVYVYKSINLIGENKHTTVVDANDVNIPIIIAADGCLVSGFTFQNCEQSYNDFQHVAVRFLRTKNVILKDNIITIGDMEYNDWVAAVDLYRSTYNIIQDNYLYEENRKTRSVGVVFREDSSHNVIAGNEITWYTNGIYVWGWDDETCINNTISNNYIHHNSNSGIQYIHGHQKIINNTISDNYWIGIQGRADDNIISGNLIKNNGDGSEFAAGIFLWTDNNIVSDNIISENYPTGIYLFSYGNTITRNNFIDNSGTNAFFSYEGRFYNSIKWKANYWSDYKGRGIKIIRGDFFNSNFPIYIPWINIDWHPAKEPYDIGVVKYE